MHATDLENLISLAKHSEPSPEVLAQLRDGLRALRPAMAVADAVRRGSVNLSRRPGGESSAVLTLDALDDEAADTLLYVASGGNW